MFKQYILFISALSALLFISSPVSVSAHLDAGSDEVIKGYLVDFGYSPAVPVALNSTFINFNLLDNSTRQAINASSIWIRIWDNGTVLFSGTFKAEDGGAALIYTFPKAGNYEILARFYNGTTPLVEYRTDLVVAERGYNLDRPKGLNSMNGYMMASILMLTILLILMVFYLVSGMQTFTRSTRSIPRNKRRK